MKWTTKFTKKAVKQVEVLPDSVKHLLFLLAKDLEQNGPATSGCWKNYGKFKGIGNVDKRHCHLVKGKPTYVCCWEVIDRSIKILEIHYVGTHEKAPY